jgi:hypothetical protein
VAFERRDRDRLRPSTSRRCFRRGPAAERGSAELVASRGAPARLVAERESLSCCVLLAVRSVTHSLASGVDVLLGALNRVAGRERDGGRDYSGGRDFADHGRSPWSLRRNDPVGVQFRASGQNVAAVARDGAVHIQALG